MRGPYYIGDPRRDRIFRELPTYSSQGQRFFIVVAWTFRWQGWEFKVYGPGFKRFGFGDYALTSELWEVRFRNLGPCTAWVAAWDLGHSSSS